jgi:hypothetical protein
MNTREWSAVAIAVLAAMPRLGKGETLTRVTIVDRGKSVWQIVSPPDQPATVQWAAGELRRYVHQMSGCDLEMVPSAGAGPAIIIGLRSKLSAEDQAALPPPAQGHDGYAVAIRGSDEGESARIVIAGENGRGVVYGVYDVLERLGCGWFYPTQDPKDPEVVPVQQTLSLVAFSWAMASPMKYRICNCDAWFFDMNLESAGKQLDWAMKNRYNAMGWQSESKTSLASQYQRLRSAGLLDELDKRGMLLHGPAHSFDHFLKAEQYFDKHPEWFGMRDGKRVPQSFVGAQFCWSNVEARKQFTSNVEAFVRACPRIDILCIVPFDGGRCCDCPRCTRIGASNLLMTLMGEVIERLRTVSPQLVVETVGGYGPMSDPPTDVEIHPRQRVVWAHWGRYYGEGYGDPGYGRRENLEKWRKASKGGITICQYYTDNFAEPWILPPFTISLIGDRKYFVENGIDSAYMLMWPPGYWWNHSLNGHIAGRCLYDVSLDPYKEIRSYAVGYFGPDAGPLLGAYYEQWAREVGLAYRVKDNATDADRAMLAAQRKQWIDPAVALVAGNPILAYRVAKVERLHRLAEQLGELHRQRQQIHKLRELGRLAEAETLLSKSRTFADETLAMFSALADLNQGLIDKNEVPSFITSGVKGWLDEEAKAIAEQKQGSGAGRK